MDQLALELEDLFDENSDSSYSHQLSQSRASDIHAAFFLQTPPTAPQLANRQRGAQLLRAIMVTAALPSRTCDFTLQVIDLTQGGSNAVVERVTHADLLAMVAAVYIYVKVRYTTGQRNLHSLLQLLEAHTPRQPSKKTNIYSGKSSTKALPTAAPGVRSGTLHAHGVERHLPDDNNFNLEKSNTLGARRNRHSSPRSRCISTAHVDSVPFCATSEAGKVGMAAWFVPVLVYSWLSSKYEQ